MCVAKEITTKQKKMTMMLMARLCTSLVVYWIVLDGGVLMAAATKTATNDYAPSTFLRSLQAANTSFPSVAPSTISTAMPTSEPPTLVPTASPSTSPPTVAPTVAPVATTSPTSDPTNAPTLAPTTNAPTTLAPTNAPTILAPNLLPTISPSTSTPTATPTTILPTHAPSSPPTVTTTTMTPTLTPLDRSSFPCGCLACTNEILQSAAGHVTCQGRMDFLQTVQGGNFTALEACAMVSEQFPNQQCGPSCHPAKCDGQAPNLCNCNQCTSQVWNAHANGATCGERILFLQQSSSSNNEQATTQVDACRTVAQEFPRTCGLCHPDCNVTLSPTTSPVPTRAPTTSMPVVSPDAPYCGCFACTTNVLDSTDADGFTCRQRIAFLQTLEGGRYNELEACRIVAEQFADNVCGPACHPSLCNTRQPTTSPTIMPPNDDDDEAPSSLGNPSSQRDDPTGLQPGSSAARQGNGVTGVVVLLVGWSSCFLFCVFCK